MKTLKGKNHGEREFTIMSGDYNEFNRVMLQLQVLEFSVIRCEPLEFFVIRSEPFLDGEGDVLYLPLLSSWMRIFWIYITA